MNEELKHFLDKEIDKTKGNNGVTVFPVPCGVGKSQYVKYRISEAFREGTGLIVVTDSVDRLNGYVSSDDDLKYYLKRNKDNIAVLTADTVASEIKDLHRKNIVLMTTQRYFNLDLSDIQGLTKNRNTVIIDEKPIIFEVRELTVKKLNDISSALSEALDNLISQEDKQYLIETYNKWLVVLLEALDNNEKENIQGKLERYTKINEFGVIPDQDIKQFQTLINKYHSQIMKYSADTYKDILSVLKLFDEGIITSQKISHTNDTTKYRNYYTVIINNIEKMTEAKADVIILDGTADISPEYGIRKLNKVNCSQFNKDLSKLCINVVNINTSKTRLTQNDDSKEYCKLISDYIKKLPQNIDTVFTYKDIAKIFEDEGFTVDWFNNIKGSNTYRDKKHIAQVGVNRCPDLIWTLYGNEITQTNDKYFNVSLPMYKIKNIMCSNDVLLRIRNNYILADIEQNLFRCQIRNNKPVDECTYTLFLSLSCNDNESVADSSYRELINMIKNRYEKLGATVNIIDTPHDFKLYKAKKRNTEKPTVVQLFIGWLNKQSKGRIFKRKDIMSECGLTESQFKDLKKTGVLSNYATDKQGIYLIK